MQLGDFIRKCREARNLSAVELSVLCNWEFERVHEMETGVRTPTFLELTTLARALDTTVVAMLGLADQSDSDGEET